MKKDGHIHTPFCPHGSTDAFEQYIEKAISEEFHIITFTEHAPLPISFVDPTPQQNSGMDRQLLDAYFLELQKLKQYYAKKVMINIGLEVDYIVGFEKETKEFLDAYGPLLDDAILSVHFLKFNDMYRCIDFSPEEYLQCVQQVGGVENLYRLYYETVHLSINSDLGQYKPKRIGHPTLVHKFQHVHGEQINDKEEIRHLLLHMKEMNYELDANSAGIRKQYCLEPYPPLSMIRFAEEIGLNVVFGSDAHTVEDLHKHYYQLF